jgi:hypothetical protein
MKKTRIYDAETCKAVLLNQKHRSFLRELIFNTTSIVRRNAPETFARANFHMINILDKLEQYDLEHERQSILRFAHACEDAGSLTSAMRIRW